MQETTLAKVIEFYIPNDFRKMAVRIPPRQRGKVIEFGCKIEWQRSGSNVEVAIVQGKNVLAKAPGHLLELNPPAPYNAAITQKKEDGTSSLLGVCFEGKNVGLELGESSNDMQAGPSTSCMVSPLVEAEL